MSMVTVDRVVEGVVKVLEGEVLSGLGAGYARGQLFAVIEILENLGGQVKWGGVLEQMELSAMRDVAAALAEKLTDTTLAGGFRAFASAGDLGEEAVGEGRALLVALMESEAFGDEEIRREVDGFITNFLVTAAMFTRPSRLTEISQG